VLGVSSSGLDMTVLRWGHKEKTYDPPSQNDARRTRASLRLQHSFTSRQSKISRITSSALPTDSVPSTSVSTKRICSASGNSRHPPLRNAWQLCASSSLRPSRERGAWPRHPIRRGHDTCPAS
jgi:hypothetical protein